MCDSKTGGASSARLARLGSEQEMTSRRIGRRRDGIRVRAVSRRSDPRAWDESGGPERLCYSCRPRTARNGPRASLVRGEGECGLVARPGTDSSLAQHTLDFKEPAPTAQRIKDIAWNWTSAKEPLPDLDRHADRSHNLYKQVEQQPKRGELPSQYLPVLARHLGADRFRCTVIRRDDDILGFVTSIRDGETLVGYSLGLDYTANSELPLYFRLLHALVAEAIETGCRRISFGRTALEAKTRLGCKPVPSEV